MKKALKMLLVSVLAATLFTSVALAEVTIGGWGRALFTPAGTEAGEISPERGVSWGGDQRIGFTVAGNSDNVGFQVDLKADNGIDQSLNNNDQQKVWVKPMDMIKLEVGPSIFYDRYRGNSGFGSWNWLRPGAVGADEDLTFRRISVNDGAVLEISPMPALGIFAGWGDTRYEWAGNDGVSSNYKENDTDSDGDGTFDSGAEPLTTAQMLALGQYGAGYDIAGIGTVRAQIIGRRNKEADADYYIINAAVKIDKLMPALYADLGFYTCTDDKDNGATSNSEAYKFDHENTEIALYVKYAMAPMTIHFQADVLLNKDTSEGEDKTAMAFGLGLDYDLGNGMGVVSDVRYADKNYVNNDNGKDGEVAVLAGVEQGFSNGKFGAAFQYSTYQLARYTTKEKADSGQWAIPIKVEYWF